jgi:hypothetical protein
LLILDDITFLLKTPELILREAELFATNFIDESNVSDNGGKFSSSVAAHWEDPSIVLYQK